MRGLRDWIALFAFILLSEGAGTIGSIFTAPAIGSWYAELEKPAIAPPNWVFAPVWTTLFLLMGVAAFFVWKRGWRREGVRKALGVFLVQLILNVLWSFIFFGQHSPGGAFAEIIVLWLAIAATIIFFARISKPAAWLMTPYIAWVTFAAYLNYMLWTLNS